MISVDEAYERILSVFKPLETERVSLGEALGRVLAEDIFADVDIPPFANSAMDGYAVRAADTFGASPYNPVVLVVAGEALPGRSPAGPAAADVLGRNPSG